ncbi:MAG: FAD:protein FMN transferase [Chromatiales bacterium]
MGTTYEIKYVAPADSVALRSELQPGVTAILDAIDRQMSTYRADSELSRFNLSATTDWVPVSADVVTVVSEALRLSEWSGGALDITVGPLVDLWGFGPQRREPRIPSTAEIAAAKTTVGYRRIQARADPPAVRKDNAGVRVDLNAIAPGFAVDRLAALLKGHGVGDFLVELGGEVYAHGRRPDGGKWRVAIERANGGVEKVVELDGVGLSTSGNYRNYFEVDGERYPHEIDPASGWPVRHSGVSVTVIAESCMRADAMSTALLVIGPERGHALAERHNLPALFQITTPTGIEARPTRPFHRFEGR